MFRTVEEDRILAVQLRERFAKQQQVLDRVAAEAEDGLLCDLGCGNGLALTYLRQVRLLPVVGVDTSSELLEQARENLPGVPLVTADIQVAPLADSSVTTVLLNKSLHEVFSVHKTDGVKRTLENAWRMLRPGGRLFIYENVVPSYDAVSVLFTTSEARELFLRFVVEYSICEIKYKLQGNEVTLSMRDALEFLTKFREPNWQSEMAEAHFIYTKRDWVEVLGGAGFGEIALHDFDDKQILSLEGVSVNWNISNFKHLIWAKKA